MIALARLSTLLTACSQTPMRDGVTGSESIIVGAVRHLTGLCVSGQITFDEERNLDGTHAVFKHTEGGLVFIL
jgi:hypothetical protein